MLKLRWAPNANPGSPGTDGYNAANDTLSVRFDPALQQVQQFAKGTPGCADASPQLTAAIDQWLSVVQGSRIIVMAHGYNFDPTGTVGGADDDPFNLVYGVPGAAFGNAETVDYHNSWLPLVGETDNFGNNPVEIALAFAWMSSGDVQQYQPAGWRNSYQYAALELAPLAAKALATVLKYLNSKNKFIYILAHSLGTRLVSQAIQLLQPGVDDKQIQKLVLLGGAEFCPDAKANLLDGRGFEVFNVANRSDLVLQVGAEAACAPFRAEGSGTELVIGRDGLMVAPNWLDIQIDLDATANWLKQRKYSVSGSPDNQIHPASFMRHWVYYMNNGDPDHPDIDGGNRKFIKDLLADPEMDIAWFRQSGFPGIVSVDGYGTIAPPAPPPPDTYNGRVAMDNPQLAAAIGAG